MLYLALSKNVHPHYHLGWIYSEIGTDQQFGAVFERQIQLPATVFLTCNCLTGTIGTTMSPYLTLLHLGIRTMGLPHTTWVSQFDNTVCLTILLNYITNNRNTISTSMFPMPTFAQLVVYCAPRGVN